MLRVGAKLPGYIHLQVTNVPRNQFIRLTSQTVCEPVRPPCPLPGNGKKKSRFRRYLGAALLVGAAGTLLYARYDKDFRQTLYCYAPWTDGVIKFVFQEEKSYQDSISSWFGLHTESLPDDAAAKSKPKAVEASATKEKKKERERCEPGADEAEFDRDETKPQTIKSFGVLRSSCTIDELTALRTVVEKETEGIVKAYDGIRNLLQDYINGAVKFVDGSAEILEPELRPMYIEKFGQLADKYGVFETQIKNSKAKINEIRTRLRECRFEGAKDIIDLNKRKIDECVKIGSDAGRTIHEGRLMKDICDHAFEKLDINRVKLMEEVNALFPNLNIPQRITLLKEQEVDLFLVYSAIQIDYYRAAVKAIENSRDSRITRALCQIAPEEVEGNNISNRVAQMVSQKKSESAAETQKKVAALKAKCEQEVAKQLARQTDVHLASLKEIQNQRAAKLRSEYSVELEKTLRQAREANLASLKEMREELRELDELFKARTDKDFSAHRSQGLWAAGFAIFKAITQLMPAVPTTEKLVKLKQEISDVVQASVEGDELITSVVRSFPPEAKERGIFTQEGLVERFDKVAKVALITSLVPAEGGPLPLYFLSWFQSRFLSTGADETPSYLKKAQHGHNNQTVPLDNYTIIKEARYWVERGDLLQAVKYMNSLDGYSRKVAASWIHEVQKYLETQQAAEIIMAHAVARGML